MHPNRLVSGLWIGHYHQWQYYPQEMTLEFADGVVRGDGRDDIGLFDIEGEYRDREGELRIGWIKTYRGAHSVLYLGALRDHQISGVWALSTYSQGAFALAAPGHAETIHTNRKEGRR